MAVSTKFTDLANELVSADKAASDALGEAEQAKAKATKTAVDVVKQAFREASSAKTPALDWEIRKTLLTSGVAKGTVSKILTVLQALKTGDLVPSDVKSLHGAYTTVKTLSKMKVAAASAAAGGGTPGTPTPALKISGRDGLKAIIAEVLAEPDLDKRFALIGEWITRCTTELSDLAKGTAEDE